MQGFPQAFWGKLEQAADGSVIAWHPLADHCADVAACTEALLRETILARRLAALAGQQRLSPVQVDRLGVLAALHDVGKFNLGFQNKARPGATPRAGHLSEVAGLLGSACTARDSLHAALRSETLDSWGEALLDLLVATLSHHGRPVGIDGQTTVHPGCWEKSSGRDPFAGIADLVARTAIWFPRAWAGVTDPLPGSTAFQHAWCGLVTLADWLGSDAERFPFSDDPTADRMPFARQQAALVCERLGLTPGKARRSLGPEAPGFERIAPSPELKPRPAQEVLLGVFPDEGTGSVVLLEAETGSGKTEAALAYFARLFHAGLVDGLYFALPTRTAATQIYRRVARAISSLFPQAADRPPSVLAVPGYLEVDGATGIRLAPFRVLWPDEPLHDRGWAAEHPKRYLAGTVAVGTVDQALLSSLTVSHAHMRSTALLRHLLVVDEVHASDTYMTRILEEVLDHHLAAGGHALLLSATLGAAARERLLARADERASAVPSAPKAAVACPYPLVSGRQGTRRWQLAVPPDLARGKKVEIELVAEMEAPEQVAQRALAAARAGARVLVLRNTVSGCVTTQLAVEELASVGDASLLFRCGGMFAPHHARYAKPDRERLDLAVEVAFGRERPEGGCVAVATQTVEQSLDLDADLLITDLCPMDVLLQRIGRLHRHDRGRRPQGYATARVVVLTPDTALASRIGAAGEARGPHGLGTVYLDLVAIEATWRTLAAHERIAIPEDNRRLVEAATHPDNLERLTHELGEPWDRHRLKIRGKYYSDRRQGTLNLVRRDLPFAGDGSGETVLFPKGDTARPIPTRLGLEDRLVRFAPPVASVFDAGSEVTKIRLPYHLVAPRTPCEAAEAEAVVRGAASVEFRFGTGSYIYDRLGLRINQPRTSGETARQEP
jgi:CRISPR-associated endonuclease/helicase Cas3